MPEYHDTTLNPWSQKKVPAHKVDPVPPPTPKPPRPNWAPHVAFPTNSPRPYRLPRT